MPQRKYRTQEPPFCVTPELVTGCNLRCTFCGVASIQEKQGQGYTFMEKETLRSLLQQVAALGWNCRIEFAMRGEPTMHPDYIGMVQLTRQLLPRCHMLMISNGGGLLRSPGPVSNLHALFKAGLNVLALDDYQGIKYVSKVREAFQHPRSGEYVDDLFTFYEYPADLAGNPHQRRPRGTRMLTIVRDIAVMDAERKKGNHTRLANSGGTGAPKNDRMEGKRCHHPFRQLAVHADGNVAVCCNDWRGEYKCGNVLKEGVAAIWQGSAMGAAREYLIRGQRSALEPCNGCDWRSYRVGLLPDLYGAGKLHKPDEQTRRDADKAMAGAPHEKPVLRPWEIA